MEKHFYNVAIPRLKKSLQDSKVESLEYDYQGGGAFRYYELEF